MSATKTKDAQVPAEPVVDSPELVQTEDRIRLDIIAEIQEMSPAEFKRDYPALFAKIAATIADEAGAQQQQKISGFLLEKGDPFSEAAERVFIKNGGVGVKTVVRRIEKSRLPMILPYSDPATKTALEGYLLRAEGGGDHKREQAARAALKKCK